MSLWSIVWGSQERSGVPGADPRFKEQSQSRRPLKSCSFLRFAAQSAAGTTRTVQSWRGRALTLSLLAMSAPATVGQPPPA